MNVKEKSVIHNQAIINPLHADFYQFLNEWESDYKESVSHIDLFNPELTSQWSDQQKAYFVKVFYHARGHFHDFLWYMGNHAPSEEAKQMVLGNISEEFGEQAVSHERLYYYFAESLGVNDIEQEAIEQRYYEPFIKDFNLGHLRWLNQHDWNGCLSAFAAYERLDNVDYISLSKLAESLQPSTRRGLTFFTVHTKVQHFESTIDFLYKVWENHPDIVKEAFHFIGNHQIEMWNGLSNKIFQYM